jgi:hypothetical protein
MAKLTLQNPSSGFSSTALFEQNNDLIEEHLNDKVLYRDNPVGEPNAMQNDLDMNSNRILNLPSATQTSEPLTYGQWTGGNTTTEFTGYLNEEHTATASQTVFTLSNSYTIGIGALRVFINGVYQSPSSYTETSTTSITFSEGLDAGDQVIFIISSFDAAGSTDAASVTYTASRTGAVQTNVQARLTEILSVTDFGATGDGSTDDTSAISSAITALASAGGVIYFPPGTYSVTTDSVATDQGTIFTLTSTHSNIVFRGAGVGVSVIKPASNELEVFAQNGATNIRFEGLTFDNSTDGILQNQVKQSTKTINTGIAGLGNGANAAIRQYEGAGLTIRDCEFLDWNVCIDYIGSNANDATLVGMLDIQDVQFDAFCFGILTQQPEHLRVSRIKGKDCIDSTNSDASTDPGHELYVTNRGGAHPETIVVSDIQSENGDSTAIKIRKGETVSVTNVSIYNATRGIEIWNTKRLTGGNWTIELADDAGDSNQNALQLTDVGYCELSGIIADLRAVDAWGLRAIDSVGTSAWHNVHNRISDMTVIQDFTGATGKAPFFIDGQTDFTLQNPRVVHEGTTNPSVSHVTVTFGTRVKVLRPVIETPDSATWDRIVSIDSNSTSCIIEWSALDTQAGVSNNTIIDNGTSTRVIQMGPVVLTSGDLTIATGAVTVDGAYHRIDTESAASTDDLDTINGGYSGHLLIISPVSSARTVVAKDGTGNLVLAGDFSMDNQEDRLVLLHNGSNYVEISRSNNGA